MPLAAKTNFFCYFWDVGDIGDITCFWLPEFISLCNDGDVGDTTCFWLPSFFSSVMFGILGISLVFGCQNFSLSVMLVILGMSVMSVTFHVFGCQIFFSLCHVGDIGDVGDLTCF